MLLHIPHATACVQGQFPEMLKGLRGLHNSDLERPDGWFPLFRDEYDRDGAGAFADSANRASHKLAISRSARDGDTHRALRTFWNLQ